MSLVPVVAIETPRDGPVTDRIERTYEAEELESRPSSRTESTSATPALD
jgi:hypothetical protein